MELLKLATTNQLFQLDGILYEQVEGVAMGSPLGPLDRVRERLFNSSFQASHYHNTFQFNPMSYPLCLKPA